MIKPISAALLTALTLCATASLAQSTRPGLWAVEHKMGGNPELEQAMAQMQKQLASMPPEQRKQMEAMMGQQGVSMAPGAKGGMALKICITPEMAARQELPSQTEGDCTTTIHSRSASALKMSYVCKNPPSSGEGTYTFSGDTAYTMKMVMNTTRQGKPTSMTMEGQGKWLSTDCGSIKPMALPKR
ncbi:DUF3617 domain-containing protein [Hydrogenophaga taeniospiralis]|jgi:Protein of unknown function (DUF3617)|uniref:DUF3617 domain-containing protein n=1 Tax=Hydrogenophaga taeniospiralis TaxID=65656 RepID=UPI001CF94BE1|nr:DUF3617 domain-containing protein [Hydrogenophaga taeniospiralis]MCB4362391.1 DUF3617 domain-containing protein [Hydrogenophaga taeniospiralis]